MLIFRCHVSFRGGGYIYKFHGPMDAFILLVDEEIPTFSLLPCKGRTLGLKRRVIWATELARPEGEHMSLFGAHFIIDNKNRWVKKSYNSSPRIIERLNTESDL